MLSINRVIVCIFVVLTTIGCIKSTSVRDMEIYYAVRTGGDDALTMRLTNSLEAGAPGYHPIAIDKIGSTSIVIFITSNLEFIKGKYGKYARFRVEFVKQDKVLGAIVGQCPVNKMKRCKDSILGRLREVME